MYAVKAIYDGANFKPQQPISVNGKYEVVITFLEPLNEGVFDIEEALPFQPKIKRRYLTTAERLKNYEGNYKTEELNTGEPIGREVF